MTAGDEAVTGSTETSESAALVTVRSTAFRRLNRGTGFTPEDTPEALATLLISPGKPGTTALTVDNAELCETEVQLSLCDWTVTVSHDCFTVLVSGMFMTGKDDDDR